MTHTKELRKSYRPFALLFVGSLVIGCCGDGGTTSADAGARATAEKPPPRAPGRRIGDDVVDPPGVDASCPIPEGADAGDRESGVDVEDAGPVQMTSCDGSADGDAAVTSPVPWAAAPRRDDAFPLECTPHATPPPFVFDRCRSGVVFDSLEPGDCGQGAYECHPGEGDRMTLVEAPGCSGSAFAIQYALPSSMQSDWASLRRVLPQEVDVSAYDYLLLPFQGEDAATPRTIEFKLEDADGCRTTALISAVTDLPAFRTVVISLDQFAQPGNSTCGGNTSTDLTRVAAFEIGISELGADVPAKDESAVGTVTFDDITLVKASDLLVDVEDYDCVAPDEVLMDDIAESMRNRQRSHGFIPTLYEEEPAQFNVYAQSLMLIVQSLDYARTGNVAAAASARAVAETLLSLQEEGAWVNAYAEGSAGLEKLTDEVYDGNVGWVTMALFTYLTVVRPHDTTRLDAALDATHRWLEQRIAGYQTRTGRTGGISDGVEASISSYFALVALGDEAAAEGIAEFLLEHAWDERRGHLRMGVDYAGLAIDTMTWGASFLRHIGRDDLARRSLGMAAGIFPARAFQKELSGLADMGPWQPATEFSMQYAAEGGPGAGWLIDQIRGLQSDAGEFRAAPDDFAGGDGWQTSLAGVAPSAHVYLAFRGGFLRWLGDARPSNEPSEEEWQCSPTVPDIPGLVTLAPLQGWWGDSDHWEGVEYESDDPVVVRRQQAKAIAMGIKGFSVNWYGQAHRTDRTLSEQLKRAALQADFQVFAMWDGGALDALAATGASDEELTDETIADLRYLVDTYSGHPAYFRVDGRPLIQVFHKEASRRVDWWRVAAAELGVELQSNELPPDPATDDAGLHPLRAFDGYFAWIIPDTKLEDGTYTGQEALEHYFWQMDSWNADKSRWGAYWVRFDDRRAAWVERCESADGGTEVCPRVVAARDGQTYCESIAESRNHIEEGETLFAYLVGWDDYEEGTAIEPGIHFDDELPNPPSY